MDPSLISPVMKSCGTRGNSQPGNAWIQPPTLFRFHSSTDPLADVLFVNLLSQAVPRLFIFFPWASTKQKLFLVFYFDEKSSLSLFKEIMSLVGDEFRNYSACPGLQRLYSVLFSPLEVFQF